MKVLDTCTGISAASLAWGPLGWNTVAFAEIDPFACRVLAQHYPDVPNWGDLTNYKAWPDAAIDVLCGGTPCQSFSLAGLRAGLDDPRGNLMLTYAAVARRYRPRWLVWENVPGVLSSNGGGDFASFLRILAELGYGFAYRVLDAQYFGLAQRRERVFVVGYLGNWRPAAAVLFDSESLRGNPAPRRGTPQDIAGTLAGGARERGGYSSDYVPAIAATLTRGGDSKGKGGYAGRRQEDDINLIAGTLRAAMGKSTSSAGPELLLAFGGNNTAASLEEATACNAKGGTGRSDFESETFIVAYTMRQHPHPGSNSLGAIAFHGSQDPCVTGDVTPTLGRNHGQEACIAFAPEVHGTLMARSSRGNGQTNTPGHNADGSVVATPQTVRRLTPRECERLQGMPDDYTRIPVRTYAQQPRGKHIHRYPDLYEQNADGTWTRYAADGPRYKALGNSWAVPVVAWIGRRIAAVEALI